MSSASNAAQTPVQELASQVFLCVNCGAQVSFEAADDADDQTELEQAACDYCDVVNDRALAVLHKRNAHERHQQRLKEKKRNTLRLFVLVSLAVVLLLTAIAAFNTQGDLSDAYGVVERSRAQLTNVRERQAAVVKRFANAPAGPDRDAELSGAENRVRIERARYDKASAAYNAQARSPWAALCARIFGLPTNVSLSTNVHW